VLANLVFNHGKSAHPELMPQVVAIYTRVSRADLDEPASTRRQERACRILAKSKGWQVAEVLEDVDVSAYARGVRRQGFERLLTLVAGGNVNGVLVWKLDRLVRRASDFERFWTRCDQSGVFLTSATEPIDSTTDLGLAVIRILVTFANAESASISLRIRSRLEEKARSGTAVGHCRQFGFTHGCHKVIPREAKLISEAAGRVLAGDSLAAIVRDWNRRRIPTAGDGVWSTHKLVKVLNSPRLVGDNTLNGSVVAKSCFPAILDRLTFARLRSAIADLKRARNSPNRYLLTSLLRCGKCGVA
jgi:site-specific DNA recombinase